MGLSARKWWLTSLLLSAALVVLLVVLFAGLNRYEIEQSQLATRADVNAYLDAYRARSKSSPIEIETGIFIQSLQFTATSDVALSGYIWQHFEEGVHDHLRPEPDGPPGFILPEQVDALGNPPREMYRRTEGTRLTIGWYFEAILRQPFDHRYYPFDHKTVWVRLWSSAFDENVVLTPALDSYVNTGEEAIFGIERSIVLGEWTWNNTYFDYKEASYDTDFGIQSYVGQYDFPELHYNFVIRRKFEDAFVTHVLTLFLVAALLFGALLTVSSDEKLAERHGFTTTGLIGASSALFFVLLLAHIQLKDQFRGAGVVYMEYLYFLMYGVLILASVNTYAFNAFSSHVHPPSAARRAWLERLYANDNLLFKVLYWPLVLGSMAAITAIVYAIR